MADVVGGGLGAAKGGIRGFFKGGFLGGAAGLVIGAVALGGLVALAWYAVPIAGAIWAAVTGGGAAVGGAASGVLGALGALPLAAKVIGGAAAVGGAVGAVAFGLAGAAGGTVGGGINGGAKGFFKREAATPALQEQLEHERELNAQKLRMAQHLSNRAAVAGGNNNPNALGGNVDRVMAGQEMAGGMKR